MECRLCLSSSPAEDLVSIHDDPRGLEHLIWTCCRLRVKQGYGLPDMVCLSCVNNLELLGSFQTACFRSDTTSRVQLDKNLKVKPEELFLDDLIWEDELSADCPPNISSSAENDEEGSSVNDNEEEGNSSRNVDSQNTVSRSIRRHKNPPELFNAEEVFKDALSTLKTTLSTWEFQEDDECDLHGKIVAKRLRKLPQDARTLIMSEIYNIFMRYDQRNRPRTPTYFSPSATHDPSPNPTYSYPETASNNPLTRNYSTRNNPHSTNKEMHSRSFTDNYNF
ncbi:uncharacterized protein LOC143913012 isoform X2 [Arctopsyche grandis]|uniref:uncharacterized protein LOC143913012 isoform X2 n=1 Tax=Arctopsyche grandis TaxID=121162 RepID=UPI00406DA2E6